MILSSPLLSVGWSPGPARQPEPGQGEAGGDRGGGGGGGAGHRLVLRLLPLPPSLLHDGRRLGGHQDRAGLQ